MNRRMIVVLLALVLSSISVANAQEKWPSRPVTLLVPFPPGGMADQTARPLANALERQLKQPIVVLNRPGGSGAVGIQAAAASKPDGYTILITLVSFTTIPMVDAIFGRMAEANAAQGGGPAPQILRAMENLKMAIRLRLSQGPLTELQVRSITSAIDAAAQDIERA